MKLSQKITYAELQEVLWHYTNYLHKKGYTDSDFYTEEPYAVDDYLDNCGGNQLFEELSRNNKRV